MGNPQIQGHVQLYRIDRLQCTKSALRAFCSFQLTGSRYLHGSIHYCIKHRHWGLCVVFQVFQVNFNKNPFILTPGFNFIRPQDSFNFVKACSKSWSKYSISLMGNYFPNICLYSFVTAYIKADTFRENSFIHWFE